MALVQLSPNVYYWQGAVNFGLVTGPDKQLILIDTGLDSGNARKALKPFVEDGWRLAAVVNTHSHADHIGGNADLVKRFGCPVWAPPLEHLFILRPELEPIGLYGGAYPPPALQTKFLQAPPTPAVNVLPEAPSTVTIAGVELELVPLPGHSLAQVGVVVEGVFIAADGFFKQEVVEKHPLIFLVNVVEYRESLARIAARPERIVVPGHGAHVDGRPDLAATLAFNHAIIDQTQRWILDALIKPLSEADLVFAVTQAACKVHSADPSYFLDRGAVAAHVSELSHRGLVSSRFEGGKRYIARL